MKRLKQLLAPALGILSVTCAHGLEPLKDSTDALVEAQVKRVINKADKNRDGKIQKEEDPTRWKRSARYDKNKDGALDAEELRSIPETYIDSPGRQLRNVLFKRTPQGGVYLDFYFPDEDKSTEKPVVVFTHGGGWAAGSKTKAGSGSFNVVHRALLKEGFCVVSVGYRKVRKGGDTAMRDCVIDSQDALRFISAQRKDLGIDPNRIFTFGDSAGGHLAMMLLLAPADAMKGNPELAKHAYRTVAGVSWYGPCDFEDIQLFNHDNRQGFRDRFGPRIMGGDTNPAEKAKRYREMSPVSFLTKDSPPLLMIQGDQDTTIPVKQAHRMREALKTIDAPVEILIVENAGHNWRSVGAPIQPSRDEIVERTIQFILKHK